MSKKATITEEMIVDAAFEIARTSGAECINARSLAAELNCTTQPVLYHFSSMLEIKAAVYMKASALLTEYTSDIEGMYDSPLLEFGMQYVRFAADESHLFRLLFQSVEFESKKYDSIVNGESMLPIISIAASKMKIQKDVAKKMLASVLLTAHGIASMIANEGMSYNETEVIDVLKQVCGLICYTQIRN